MNVLMCFDRIVGVSVVGEFRKRSSTEPCDMDDCLWNFAFSRVFVL